jgi:hypothetical protein
MFIEEIFFKGWIKMNAGLRERWPTVCNNRSAGYRVASAALLFHSIRLMIDTMGLANPFFRCFSIHPVILQNLKGSDNFKKYPLAGAFALAKTLGHSLYFFYFHLFLLD